MSTDHDTDGGKEPDGIVLDTPDPPGDLPYADFEDYRAKELLRVNGIAPTSEGALVTLKSDENILRAAAAHVLGSIGDAAAIPQLRKVADDSEDLVKAEAAYALVRLGEKRYREVLKECLAYPLNAYLSPSVAAGYLARLGDPAGFPVLVEAFKVDNLIARVVACKQLSFFVPLHGQRVGRRRVDAHLVFGLALRDEQAEVQRIALIQLRELRSPESRKLLERYLPVAAAEYLRDAAQRALDRQ